MSGASSIAGVILAGGLARRMGGGDKPLVAVGGRPMLDHVVERLAPQVQSMAINANGDPGRFAAYGLPVVPDTVPGFAGPLAGILAGMRWAQKSIPAARNLVSVAGDTPFFPHHLVSRLAAASRDEATVVLAASGAGTHPVFGLWPIALAHDLEGFLTGGESGKILAFVDRHRREEVFFNDLQLADGQAVDPFFNVNTPEDAASAQAIAAALLDRSR